MSLRRDLAALYAGYYIAELLTDLTDFHDPHPKLFDAATITLRHLGDAGVAAAAGAPVRAGVPARTGADAGARRSAPIAARRSTRRETIVAFGLATGGVLCPAAGPASRTWRRSRAGPSRRSGSWPVPGAAGETWTSSPAPSGSAPVRTTLGAVISHLWAIARVLPYLGVVNRWTWLPSALANRDRIPCTIARPHLRSRAAAVRLGEGPSSCARPAGVRPGAAARARRAGRPWRSAWRSRPGQTDRSRREADRLGEGRRAPEPPGSAG